MSNRALRIAVGAVKFLREMLKEMHSKSDVARLELQTADGTILLNNNMEDLCTWLVDDFPLDFSFSTQVSFSTRPVQFHLRF